jgi:hypothetical protein
MRIEGRYSQIALGHSQIISELTISIASVWQQRRPVIKDLAASRHRLCIDTSLCRTVALAELANAIPRSSYLFGVSWPDVRRTLLVAVEQNGDPYAVMIPTLVKFQQRYQMRNRILSKTVSAWEFYHFCNSQKCAPFSSRVLGV